MATVVNPHPHPVNLDRQILKIQQVLSPIEWLEYAFGRAWTSYRLSERKGTVIYPNVYVSKGEYANMLPTDRYRSYCYFIPQDGLRKHRYVAIPKTSRNSFKSALDIVFYFNLKKIDPEADYVHTENLLFDVLRTLRSVNNYTVDEIFYEPKNVFDGYTIDFIETQYLSYPYGGFRISGTLIFDEDLKDC
jgi:hypothetical protein